MTCNQGCRKASIKGGQPIMAFFGIIKKSILRNGCNYIGLDLPQNFPVKGPSCRPHHLYSIGAVAKWSASGSLQRKTQGLRHSKGCPQYPAPRLRRATAMLPGWQEATSTNWLILPCQPLIFPYLTTNPHQQRHLPSRPCHHWGPGDGINKRCMTCHLKSHLDRKSVV